MFNTVSPESVGISSAALARYLGFLEKRKVSTQGIVAARGNNIFLEVYAEPYDKGSQHRMYSQTKSFVGLAIALLKEEGKLNYSDKIISFFPESLPETVHPYLAAQTIYDMLNMQTCFFGGGDWFSGRHADRVKYYFNRTPERYPGTGYNYDSNGSFVLCALAEKLSGMKVLDYLRKKCLDTIGFSKEARILLSPGGYSWGDSALLCTHRDMLAFVRLIGCGGVWEGKRIISESVIADVTKRRSAVNTDGARKFSAYGYGFQLWHFTDDTIGFNGMHDQVTLYNKKTDISYTVTSCNPFDAAYREVNVGAFIEKIIGSAADKPLSEDKEGEKELAEKIKGFALPCAEDFPEGKALEKKLDGATYICEDNPMKIEYFRIDFTSYGGTFSYKNAQGEKVLRFGRGTNILQQFPQTGYSSEIGSVPCENHTYRCAVSAGFENENQFTVRVQIIDDYNGTLQINLGFNGDYAFMNMSKNAEDFLNEYSGFAAAKRK